MPDSDPERSVTLPAAETPTQTLSSEAPPPVAGLSLPPARLPFLERYTPEAEIGSGGMGIVTLQRDAQVGRRVALKVMRNEYARNDILVTRFLREARVQGQLEHPAIVPVYDLGVDPDGVPYFTMKRVHGATLSEVLDALRAGDKQAQREYTRRKLLSVFVSVCHAVEFAHERNVLHRDLKPDNVMLGEHGEVYVLDWGLAKLLDGSEERSSGGVELPQDPNTTAPGAVLGTPGYLPPEQIDGSHAPSVASDVYMLGAILFELLTLQTLNPLEPIDEALRKTLAGDRARCSERAPDRDVPLELEALCVRATAREPAARFESAHELGRAVERFLDGERDDDRRRELSREHAMQASKAAERALSETGSATERRIAMRHVGRALALDPENHEAVTTMIRLLGEPPAELPGEVKVELRRAEEVQMRWTGRVGFYTFLGLLGLLPALLVLGVRSWSVVVGFALPVAVASGLSLFQSLRRRPRHGAVLLTMLLSNVGFAVGAGLFGPHVVVPLGIAVNATAFAVHLRPKHRSLSMGVATAALILPTLLELVGVIPPSTLFQDGMMCLVPRAVALPESPTLLLLVVTGVIGIFAGSFAVGRMRDQLYAAERRTYLYAWHLREFVPETARAATDPTVTRVTST